MGNSFYAFNILAMPDQLLNAIFELKCLLHLVLLLRGYLPVNFVIFSILGWGHNQGMSQILCCTCDCCMMHC